MTRVLSAGTAGSALPEVVKAAGLGLAETSRAMRVSKAVPLVMSTPLEPVTEPPMPTAGPAEEAASREEEALVWQTLERIDETYREPLVLFYREQQSVAEVAAIRTWVTEGALDN